MRLAGVRAGDIVRVNDGLPHLAEVVGQDGARVRVAPITGLKGDRAKGRAHSQVTGGRRTLA